MLNTVKEALAENEFRYETIREEADQVVFRMGMSLDNGRYDVIMDVRMDEKRVLIYAVSPTMVPQNQRSRVSEYLTRANYGLVTGNFEMDFSDGEIRYKSNIIYDEISPVSVAVFMRHVSICFWTMDKYYPGIMAVIYARVLPEHAVSQVENAPDPSLN